MNQSEQKEKFQKYIQNIKNYFHKDNIAAFFQRSWRYFAAVALLAVLTVLMVRFASPVDGDSNGVADTEKDPAMEAYEVDAVAEVKELITQYYAACAAGDTEAVQTYAVPVSASELSHISMMAQFVESYQNIVCYTKPGLEEGSYLTSVTVELKFAGVETPAPGMEFFYVRTNAEGVLYIDNVYSGYNRQHKELEADAAVSALIQQFEQQKDVKELQARVQQEYEQAVAADSNLMTMVNVTLADAYNTWALEIAGVQNGSTDSGEEPPATEPVDTEAPVDTETTEPTPPEPDAQPEQPDDNAANAEPQTQYATDTVNVRQQPDETADILGKLQPGEAVMVSNTADGWSQIDYNGTPGYVKSEYLSTETDQAEVSGPAPGGTVTLTNTINIRSSMSETASKVAVAYAGERVTVEMNYAEGWSKVVYNGQSGYAKTEFIK